MKRIQKGFTLIELMIVVAIIGILAAVAIPAYQDYVVKAKLSKVQASLDPIKLALAMYAQESGSFPNANATLYTDALWTSIGLVGGPTPVNEISHIDINGTAGTTVTITLTLGNGIKVNTIDGKKVDIIGAAGATAVTWQAGTGTYAAPSGTCATATPVTEPLAIKYFGC